MRSCPILTPLEEVSVELRVGRWAGGGQAGEGWGGRVRCLDLARSNQGVKCFLFQWLEEELGGKIRPPQTSQALALGTEQWPQELRRHLLQQPVWPGSCSVCWEGILPRPRGWRWDGGEELLPSRRWVPFKKVKEFVRNLEPQVRRSG